jgi:hypothetical protein
MRKETDDLDEISMYDVSSPDEFTPAIERTDGYKLWCKIGYIWHRLTGHALIHSDGNYFFRLNGKDYDNIYDWLQEHPNQDLSFKKEMVVRWG